MERKRLSQKDIKLQMPEEVKDQPWHWSFEEGLPKSKEIIDPGYKVLIYGSDGLYYVKDAEWVTGYGWNSDGPYYWRGVVAYYKKGEKKSEPQTS